MDFKRARGGVVPNIARRGPRATEANLGPLRAHNILVGGPASQTYETPSAPGV